MSTENITAIVLSRWDIGEHNRKLSLLTREKGKLYAVARGVRKAKSRNAGITEPLTVFRTSIAFGKNTNYIAQTQPILSFSEIRKDFFKLNSALAWVETIDEVTRSGENIKNLFDFCLFVLNYIQSLNNPLNALCWGDLQLMRHCGYSPNFEMDDKFGKNIKKYKLSPRAGGVINENESAIDEFDVSIEALIALQKIQLLEEPPKNLKKNLEVSKVLHAFWQEFLEKKLPARQMLLNTISASHLTNHSCSGFGDK